MCSYIEKCLCYTYSESLGQSLQKIYRVSREQLS